MSGCQTHGRYQSKSDSLGKEGIDWSTFLTAGLARNGEGKISVDSFV